MKRGCPPDLLLHDLEFGVAGQEATGVITRQAERGLREVVGAEADPAMRDGDVRDLVQTALGLSRDDSGSFLPGYAELEIVKKKVWRTAMLRHD